MASAFWPHLTVHDGKAAVEFYKKGLGAVAERVMPMPAGDRLMHASMKVGDAVFMLNDDFPEYCGGVSVAPKTTGAAAAVTMHLNVPDCDAAVAKMASAGATVKMPPGDMFWGDRYGVVVDPFGHQWSFATPLPPDRAKAAAESFKGM